MHKSVTSPTKEWGMRYNDLKSYFTKFHLGEISKLELTAAIIIWQRAGAML
jgi:hypothetical protein